MTRFAAFAGLLIVAAAGVAADWSQFRGPGGTGIAAAADPPLSWGDAKSLRWKTPLPGPGSSSPIIVGDRIFLTYYTDHGGESKSDKPSDLKRHLLRDFDAIPAVDGRQPFLRSNKYLYCIESEDKGASR